MKSVLMLFAIALLAEPVTAQQDVQDAPMTTVDSVLSLSGLPMTYEALDDSTKTDAIQRTIHGQLARQQRPGKDRRASLFGQTLEWSVIPPASAPADSLSVWMLPIQVDRFVQGKLAVENLSEVTAYMNGKELSIDDARIELALPPGIHDLWMIHAGAEADAEPAVRFEGEAEHDRIRVRVDPSTHVTAERLTNAQTVSRLQISPDGERLALWFSGRDDAADLSLSRLEIRSIDSGEVARAWTDDVPDALLWSPDSRTLALRQGSNLWLHPQGSSPRLLLANHEHLGDFVWHPDGESLLFSWTAPEEEPDEQRRRIRSLEDRWANQRDNSQLFEVDVASGLIRPLTNQDVDVNLLDVDPEGERLLLSQRVIDYSEPPHSLFRLVELNLDDLSRREITRVRMISGALFADDGYWLLSGPGLPGADGATTEAPLISNEYDTQLYRLSADGESARSVSREFDPSIGSAHRLPGGDLLLSVTRGEGTALVRFDAERERFEDLDTGFEVMEQFSASEGRRVRVAVRGTGAVEPQRVHLLDLARDRRRVFIDSRPTEYADVEFGAIRDWTFTNADGDEIEGRYYLPPDFNPKQRYPMIVYYYGGTVPVQRAFTGRYPFNLWAAKGYVVYVLQPRGTVGYGQAFSALHVNAWGKYTADDIIEGTQKFLAAHDFVDPERVGNIGASYGGFMTMYLATLTDIYAASISHAGISTLTSYWGEGWWGYGYSGIASRGSFPWNNRELYVEQSPIYNADKITTPLLLVTGDSDTNVPPGESDTMFTALKLLDREVELVEFPGEDHWILDREKRYSWWDTMLAWFDRHLKDQPEWWSYLYPES